MKMQLAEIAQALNTSCEGDAETVITSVAFDSRKISQGALFIPIKGKETATILWVQPLKPAPAPLCGKLATQTSRKASRF